MGVPQAFQGERRILVTGGGTGGHVYPALGVLQYLARRIPRLSVLWVGSDRIESQILRDEGVDFFEIDIRFSYRRISLSNIEYYRRHLIPIFLGKPYRQAKYALETFRPELVLGTGGYVSAPALLAAQRLGIPYALLQLDNPPGLVNWLMADRAWKVFASTPEVAAGFSGRCSQEKINVCGYPAMPGRTTSRRLQEEFKIDKGRRVLLAMGGSLGAGAVNTAVRDMIHHAARDDDACCDQLAIIHVGGERALETMTFEETHALTRGRIAYRPVNYIEDVPGLMSCCDFYIGRSGAATVGELIAASIPSLLIPDPQHADGQQRGNALELVRRGLGTIIDQGQASGVKLLDWLRETWRQPKPRKQLVPAADEIADEIIQVWSDD